MTKNIKLKVYRYLPNAESPHYDTLDVPTEHWTTVLDALLYIKAYKDHSIAIRYSCRQASCGSCGMMINGIPRLACYTKIDEFDTDTITCAPLANFPVVRDLVVNFATFFQHHKDMKPYVMNDIETDEKTREFLQSPQNGTAIHHVYHQRSSTFHLLLDPCCQQSTCTSALVLVGLEIFYP